MALLLGYTTKAFHVNDNYNLLLFRQSCPIFPRSLINGWTFVPSTQHCLRNSVEFLTLLMNKYLHFD